MPHRSSEVLGSVSGFEEASGDHGGQPIPAQRICDLEVRIGREKISRSRLWSLPISISMF